MGLKCNGLLMVMGLLLAGCGAQKAIDATKKVPEKLDRTLSQLDKTECELKRGLSFEALLKDEYGRDLSPVPFDLIPFAREFAKCASEEDLAEIVYLWMKKLNEVTLDIANPTPAQVAEFDHRKQHIYFALAAVSGFVPEAKIQGIINTQVYGAGRYQESTYQLLMLRVQFLRDIMLNQSLFTEGLTNVGKVLKAMEYADDIEYVARLPFAPEIRVEATGFYGTENDIKEALKPKVALDVWKDIRTRAARLSSEMDKLVGKPGQDPNVLNERRGRLGQALGVIESRINGW